MLALYLFYGQCFNIYLSKTALGLNKYTCRNLYLEELNAAIRDSLVVDSQLDIAFIEMM